MLDLKLEDIDGILVRYNVALEKEMTPDEAAEELYPKDELIYPIAVLHQLDPKIIYPHYDFKHLTEKYFEIGMKLNDFSIQLVKYWIAKAIYEGKEDDVIDALKAAIDVGKKPINLINDALMVGMGVVSQLYDKGIIFLPNVMMSEPTQC